MITNRPSSSPPDAACTFLTNQGDGRRGRPDIFTDLDATLLTSTQRPSLISSHVPQSPQQADHMQANYANYLPPIPIVQSLSHIPLPDGPYHSSSAVPPAEMGILSAECYDDGNAPVRPARKQPRIPFGLLQQQHLSREETVKAVPKKTETRKKSTEREQASGEKRRKKLKVASDDEGEDEASKKARGRPRLDTKDETAADRRRTQIRMAQRAYRHRKETTISSLERQVQDLTTANEQMSNIFISLHDYAVGRGILHREPEFGSQLKSATEQFLTLARSVQVEENKDEEGTSIDESKRSPSEEADPKSDNPSLHPTSTGVISEPENPQSAAGVWGYQVTREDDSPSPNTISQDWNQQEEYMPLARPHLVISRPTFNNASFGFDFSENFS